MPTDPIALARTLIDIPSVTGSEGAHASKLEEVLTGLGFRCERQEIEPGRFNLFATAGGTPRVVFCSHTDTVPPFFPSREEGGFVYGRGACDTKGIIAAMVAAGERLKEGGVTDFGFLFVVAEETDSVGAKEANRHFAGRGVEYVVVGEPTESTFVRASKGALTVFVRFEGVAAHSAYPERGESAIRKLLAALTEIDAMEWGDDPVLGRGTVNIGVVRGGRKPNIIPDEAEAEMIFRTVEPIADVRARLEEVLARHGGKITMARGNDPTFMMVPHGAESVVVGFNTDAPHLGNLGRPCLYGPGSILDAHSATERIAAKDILAAVDVYHDFAISLLTGKVS